MFCPPLLIHRKCLPNGQLGTLHRELQGPIRNGREKLGFYSCGLGDEIVLNCIGFPVVRMPTTACLLVSLTSESSLYCSLCDGDGN